MVFPGGIHACVLQKRGGKMRNGPDARKILIHLEQSWIKGLDVGRPVYLYLREL